MDSVNESPISNFFFGRSVFITGASGFVGKVLVEKLLRSCSDIKNIYLLLRSKKGQSANTRLDELLNSKAFDRIRQANPKLLDKVIAIQGDITFDGLGISEQDMNKIRNEISIVFHSAATVKFDEQLRKSIDINVLGTRRIIKFCRQLTDLAALIHVSTAYSNCYRDEIDEIIYPAAEDPNRIIEMVKWMSDDTLDSLTPKLLGPWPNTYTYTKSMAENLVKQEGGSLPIAIIRPSIVTAALEGPYPGWVDSLNGATGLIAAAGKGLVRSMLCTPDGVADIVPVDIVTNLMITSAWFTATKSCNEVLVYNCTTGDMNPMTWAQLEAYALDPLLKYPLGSLFRYPQEILQSGRLKNKLSIFFNHHLVAYLIDFICAIIGRKQKMVKLYAKVHKAMEVLEWFTTHSPHFKSKNVRLLCNQLQSKDKEIFRFDVREIEWIGYWNEYVKGIRKFILCEKESNLEVDRAKAQRLLYFNKAVEVLALLGAGKVLMMQSETARELWGYISGSIFNLFSTLSQMRIVNTDLLI